MTGDYTTKNSKIFFYGSSRLFWQGTGLTFIDYISGSAMDALLFGEVNKSSIYAGVQ